MVSAEGRGQQTSRVTWDPPALGEEGPARHHSPVADPPLGLSGPSPSTVSRRPLNRAARISGLHGPGLMAGVGQQLPGSTAPSTFPVLCTPHLPGPSPSVTGEFAARSFVSPSSAWQTPAFLPALTEAAHRLWYPPGFAEPGPWGQMMRCGHRLSMGHWGRGFSGAPVPGRGHSSRGDNPLHSGTCKCPRPAMQAGRERGRQPQSWSRVPARLAAGLSGAQSVPPARCQGPRGGRLQGPGLSCRGRKPALVFPTAPRSAYR